MTYEFLLIPSCGSAFVCMRPAQSALSKRVIKPLLVACVLSLFRVEIILVPVYENSHCYQRNNKQQFVSASFLLVGDRLEQVASREPIWT